MAASAGDQHNVGVPSAPFQAAAANVVDGGIHHPAPPAVHGVEVQGGRPGEWSTGLCSCFDDVGNCCITCCCPCVTFGQIAEIMDRGSGSCGASGALYAVIMLLTGCQCIYSCYYRRRMRGQYELEETPCPDCVVHCCCEGCALCQEYRELRNRGFDMNIGWYANVQRQQQAPMAPPMPEQMRP